MPLSSAEFIPHNRPGFTSKAVLSIYFSKSWSYHISILSTLKMISELAAFQLLRGKAIVISMNRLVLFTLNLIRPFINIQQLLQAIS